MIGQLIQLDMPAEWRGSVMDRLAANVAGSRQEPGCHAFRAALDAVDLGRIWVWEEFTDQAALDAHYLSSHFQDWRTWLTTLPEGTVRRTRISLLPCLLPASG
jgi:quinol monooxygenase YgiN